MGKLNIVDMFCGGCGESMRTACTLLLVSMGATVEDIRKLKD